MRTKSLRSLATLSFLLFTAGVAISQQHEPGVSDDSLNHAVQMLERKTGGKVLEVRLSDEPGNPSFDAVIVKGDDLLYMHIAAPNDAITSIEIKQLPEWMVGRKLTAYMKSIRQAKVPLAQAITIGERMANKPAIGAGLAAPLSGSNAVLAYNIEVMKAGKRERIAIDAITGAPIANPDELYVEWTPVKLLRRIGV
ncbi:MAG TPA: PepSY domain-containing protein [Candidatus Sulfotelmatobacter sp.]|nr:PepSY domain-containing protein [Candidatus Sulfotelmatobacter sp.]